MKIVKKSAIMIPIRITSERRPISKSCRDLLKKQLLKESSMVADDSMAVLEKFERFEEDYIREKLGKKNPGGKGDE
jgi:hypothetical protein